jgi:L-lactate dehydrogenase complex protein LldG
VPERARKTPAGLRALFAEHLKGQSATVIDAASLAEVPVAIAGYLRSNNLPMRLRLGADQRLAGMPWTKEPALTLDHGPARQGDEVTLSHAAAAVAETGTLLMASGPDNPVTLNYLPDNHIVIVDARDLAGHYEAAFDSIRARLGRTVMPRTLNFISGPSRSADIGGKPVLGAHGPRRLCVIVVGD